MNCKYVGSYALHQTANVRDQFSSDLYILNLDTYKNILPNSLVHVCTQSLPMFVNHVLPTISVPFQLITNNSDSTVNEDYPIETESILNSDFLIHWFAQNCTLTHPKITRIPIGLDYHSMIPESKRFVWVNAMSQHHCLGTKKLPIYQEQDLKVISSSAKPFHERKLKSYANFHFLMKTRYGKVDRVNAFQTLPLDVVDYEVSYRIRNDCWKTMTEYAFVVSPAGNGLDCHRTWEALVLGCIPIVKTSGLDLLYTDLPVWIVNDWSEVTVDNMKLIIESYKTKSFNMEKLTLNYWTKLITASTSAGLS